MTDEQGAGGVEVEVDYAEMARPEALRDLNDDEWNATPPTVRKAIVERENRSKVNHTEQIARLTAEMNSMREMLAASAQTSNGHGNGATAKKAAGIEGMDLSELESYHDRAEEILALARKEPDNEAAQREAAKLTPAVMRELMKAIARKSIGVSKDDLESLRNEIRGDKEAMRMNGALHQKVTSEFGPAAIMPGNAMRLAAE